MDVPGLQTGSPQNLTGPGPANALGTDKSPGRDGPGPDRSRGGVNLVACRGHRHGGGDLPVAGTAHAVPATGLYQSAHVVARSPSATIAVGGSDSAAAAAQSMVARLSRTSLSMSCEGLAGGRR